LPALKLQKWNSSTGSPTASRTVRREPADVPDGQGEPGPHVLELGVRGELAVQGTHHRLRLPIYIADAALYLKATQPRARHQQPYALDQKQFDAAVALLKVQNKNIGEYWSDYLKSVASFKSGNSVIGTTWQVIANTAVSEKAPVKTVLPAEGATGWSDTWMLYSKAQHPNCAYRWMDWITSPTVNAQVAEYFGEAPADQLACQHTVDKTFCTTYHAADRLLEAGRVLVHPDPAVPGRPHQRQVRAVRPVGAGLDLHQG